MPKAHWNFSHIGGARVAAAANAAVSMAVIHTAVSISDPTSGANWALGFAAIGLPVSVGSFLSAGVPRTLGLSGWLLFVGSVLTIISMALFIGTASTMAAWTFVASVVAVATLMLLGSGKTRR